MLVLQNVDYEHQYGVHERETSAAMLKGIGTDTSSSALLDISRTARSDRLIEN